MEDVRSRDSMSLTFDREHADKWFSKLVFKSDAFNGGLYLTQTPETATIYDRPVYVGCSFLAIRKVRTLDFHCNEIHKQTDGAYDCFTAIMIRLFIISSVKFE